jgi:hypothetical protein
MQLSLKFQISECPSFGWTPHTDRQTDRQTYRQTDTDIHLLLLLLLLLLFYDAIYCFYLHLLFTPILYGGPERRGPERRASERRAPERRAPKDNCKIKCEFYVASTSIEQKLCFSSKECDLMIKHILC